MKYIFSMFYILLLASLSSAGDTIVVRTYISWVPSRPSITVNDTVYYLFPDRILDSNGILSAEYWNDQNGWKEIYLPVKKGDTSDYPNRFKIYCYDIIKGDTNKILIKYLGPSTSLAPQGIPFFLDIKATIHLDTISYSLLSYIDSSFQFQVGNEIKSIKIGDTCMFNNGAIIYVDWTWQNSTVHFWLLNKSALIQDLGYDYWINLTLDSLNFANGLIKWNTVRCYSDAPNKNLWPYGVKVKRNIIADSKTVQIDSFFIYSEYSSTIGSPISFKDSIAFDFRIDPDNRYKEPNETNNKIYLVFKKTSSVLERNRASFKKLENADKRTYNLLGRELRDNHIERVGLIVKNYKPVIRLK